ncbi:hypothetical protein IT396_00260 [Candidatus Nomurabacteria bacterium]|nr:hypothetical protein [Candidatus Nomurabacteria bacterium]
MDLNGVVRQIIGSINVVIPVLITIALVFFLWGILRYVYKVGNAHSKESDRQIFLWGLLALFCMVSVWGIVATLCLQFFGDRNCQNVQNVQCTDSGCFGA